MRNLNLHLDRLGSSEQALLTLNDFFHGGKTARQKEAEKRLKEQEELRKKAQEQIALNEELANQQRFFMEEMLSPYRRPIGSGEEAYLLSNGWPSPDTATSGSNDKPQQINDAQDNTNDDLFKNSFVGVVHDDKGASFGGGYTPPGDDKKYYDLGNLKTLDDYLGDPLQSTSSNPIFNLTTPNKKVYYTLVPYANASTGSNITYVDASLLLDTGLGLAMRYGAPALQGIIPYARGSLYTGIGLLALKEAWDGTKELAKYVFAPDPALEAYIYDSTKHLSASYIKGKENTVKASLAATREINSDTCYMMRDWSFLQKFQYFTDKAEFWGNIYLNPRSLPWLDGTAKHRILHYQIEEYNVRCKDTSIRSEIVVLNGRIHLNGRPASIKGASIVDGITSKENELGYWEVADFKSGILGITDEKAEKLGINMQGKQFKLYDVRASNSIHGPTREFDLNSLKMQK